MYSFVKVHNDKKMARAGISIPNRIRHLVCILNYRYFYEVEYTFTSCLTCFIFLQYLQYQTGCFRFHVFQILGKLTLFPDF